MYGYTANEAIGQPIARIIPHANGESWPEGLVHIRQGEPLVASESTGVRKDGTHIAIAITVSPLRNAHGTVIGASVVTKDISQLKDAMQEAARRSAEFEALRETTKLKDHFLSTISHEMKTPLSLINGYAELLEDVCHETQLIQGIQEGSRRLTKHINSMLDYSALLSGTLQLDLIEIGLQEVVDWAIGEAQPGFARQGVALEMDIPKDLPPVTCDPRRLAQVLTELLDNAQKFTRSGGKAGIRACRADGRLRIEVWDTGSGIAEDDRARIWTAFTQLDVGDALRKGGLGLGLTLAKQLVELHGGHVELESQEGRGSTFALVLPLQGT
jgi:PAS domain S-box-containing protein